MIIYNSVSDDFQNITGKDTSVESRGYSKEKSILAARGRNFMLLLLSGNETFRQTKIGIGRVLLLKNAFQTAEFSALEHTELEHSGPCLEIKREMAKGGGGGRDLRMHLFNQQWI